MDWQRDLLDRLGEHERQRQRAPDPSDDPPRFQPRRVLGRGGMGEVVEAFDTKLQRPVALKRLGVGGPPTEADRQRFAREGQALARLRHPGIVRVHEAFEDSHGQPVLVMDLIEGRPLSEWVRAGDPLPATRAVGLVTKLADAIAALHAAGIVHRDLKPENVMVQAGDEPVLIDFGIAHTQGSERLTATGALIGTPHYMAPEQARGRGRGDPDPRTDVYGLGAILFALLAGRPPHAQRGELYELLAAVVGQDPGWDSVRTPAALRRIAQTAMAKAVEDRYTDALALRDALRDYEQHPDGSPQGAGRGLFVAVLVAALVAALVGTTWVGRPQRAGNRTPAIATVPVEAPPAGPAPTLPVAPSRRRGHWRPQLTLDFVDAACEVPDAVLAGQHVLTFDRLDGKPLRVWDLEDPARGPTTLDLAEHSPVVAADGVPGVAVLASRRRLDVIWLDERRPQTIEIEEDLSSLCVVSRAEALVGTKSGWLHSVDLELGSVTRLVRHATSTPLGQVAAAGGWVVTGSGNRDGSLDFSVGIWSGGDPLERRRTVRVYNPVATLALGPSARTLAIGTEAGRVFLVPLEGGEVRALESKAVPTRAEHQFLPQSRDVPFAHADGLAGLAFSDRGEQLLSVGLSYGAPAPLRVWDVASGEELPPIPLSYRVLSTSTGSAGLLLTRRDTRAELWTPSADPR